ncbi:MAG: DNA starvation/stationary phase protection protein [Lutibacter sp.]|nr:DNA starvation/stationary phase protection protein [Lutibacter sp.]
METQTTTKFYKKLGFTYLETAEIVVILNKIIANYTVHYHKLRRFHWNIEGSNFFELHQQFELEYENAKDIIDILAERIRVFGIKINYTLNQFIELSDIRDDAGELTSLQMVQEVLKDFNVIHNDLLEASNYASNAGDIGTEEILASIISDLEKRHWMFTVWTKSN